MQLDIGSRRACGSKSIGSFQPERPRVPANFIQANLNVRAVSCIHLIGSLGSDEVGIVDSGAQHPAGSGYIVDSD